MYIWVAHFVLEMMGTPFFAAFTRYFFSHHFFDVTRVWEMKEGREELGNGTEKSIPQSADSHPLGRSARTRTTGRGEDEERKKKRNACMKFLQRNACPPREDIFAAVVCRSRHPWTWTTIPKLLRPPPCWIATMRALVPLQFCDLASSRGVRRCLEFPSLPRQLPKGKKKNRTKKKQPSMREMWRSSQK